MTADEPPTAAPPPGGTARPKPPTIDLTATEIEPRPDPAGSSEAPAQAASEPQAGAPEHAAEVDAADVATHEPGPSSDGEQQTPPPRRAGHSAGALLGAGVLGGAVAAAALWAAGLLVARDNDTSALEARLAALELQAREVAAQPRTPAPAAGDASSANRFATLEGEVTRAAEAVAVLGRRTDEITTMAGEARTRADAATAAVAELTQKLARGTPSAVQKSDLDALATRLAAVEVGEKAVEAALAKRPQADDRAGRLAVAATALRTAVERGDAFAAEFAAVKALGADARLLTALEPFAASGLPRAAVLARELSALQPALLQAAGAAPRNGGILERLQVNAEKLVRIRPVEEVAGSDPAAIIARAEVKAGRSDFAGAVAELATLPEAARAAAAPWIAQAQKRIAAADAAQRLASDALAGLGTGLGK